MLLLRAHLISQALVSYNIRTAIEGASKGFLDRPKIATQKAWYMSQYAKPNNQEAILD